MNYRVVIDRYAPDHAARCFCTFAQAMAESLRMIGHAADVDLSPGAAARLTPATTILIGKTSADGLADRSDDVILYNAEQVCAPSAPYWTDASRCRDYIVWDFASSHVDWWRTRDVRAVYCPFGYAPSMERITPRAEEDIDVLFVGRMNARSREILDTIINNGLHVDVFDNLYDTPLDQVIARTKVVLNLHYYEGAAFEIFRVGDLLANRKCVVSENGGGDFELEAFARDATILVPPDRIASACVKLVADVEARRAGAARGYSAWRRVHFADTLRRALAETDRLRAARRS